MSPTDPPPFDQLRAVALELKLAGNEARIVDALCRGGGRVPLAELAVVCEWLAPYGCTWNSARGRLNGKLHSSRWRLGTHDGCAIAQQLPG